uniref:Sodium/bile acid cotransporter n=1 Tax=Lotharella globosa TaxID=91324 RepID=A0A7S3YU58_9EUKA
MSSDKSDKCIQAASVALRDLFERMKRQWFILSVIIAIVAAHAAPWVGKKGGPLMPSVAVPFAVACIFLIIGLSLKTRQLKDTILQWRIHTTVQLFSLLLTPLIMCSAANGCEALADRIFTPGTEDYKSLISLLEGVKVLSCMPSPVSSAVILTKAVGANEAAAAFNATLGSFLGVLITPLMLLQITGTAAEVPIMQMISGLGTQIVFPIVLGQSLRGLLFKNPDEFFKTIPLSKISSGTLVFIIYTVFCDTFSGNFEVEIEVLLGLVIFLLLWMIFLIFLVYTLASTAFPSLSRSDLVAIIFCSTHKSLTLGMPLLKILFGGDPDISIAVISIPLLIYHPLQILLGSCLIVPMQKWVDKDPQTKGANTPRLNAKPNGVVAP